MLPGETAAVIGRDAEIARVAAAIATDRPVALVGEAGVGKTTVVRAAAAAARRRLWEGGGFATLTHLPYLALRRAVGTDLAGGAVDVAAIVEKRIGPDLLFIDDLQWVDRATRPVLELLAGRVAIALAIRTWDAGAAEALELAEGIGADVTTLAALDADAAALLVRRVRPGLGASTADAIVRRAGGNPLLIEELATRGEAPATFARLVASQVAALTPAGRHAIELLAIADRPLPDAVVGDGAEDAVRAGLATRGTGVVVLRHALVGEAIRDDLADAERRLRHEELAGALEDPPEIARHLASAGRDAEAATVALAAVAKESDPWIVASLLSIAASTASADLELRLRAARALDRRLRSRGRRRGPRRQADRRVTGRARRARGPPRSGRLCARPPR